MKIETRRKYKRIPFDIINYSEDNLDPKIIINGKKYPIEKARGKYTKYTKL